MAKSVALGGMMAALAVVIMSMGTIVPIATYAAPMLCILICNLVYKICGGRMAWAWYGAVTILAALLAPDKEAAAVFAALGSYPMVRPGFQRRKLPWLWKGIYFNALVVLLYWLLMNVLGLGQIAREFAEMGTLLTLVALGVGNVTFFLMDRVLDRKF